MIIVKWIIKVVIILTAIFLFARGIQIIPAYLKAKNEDELFKENFYPYISYIDSFYAEHERYPTKHEFYVWAEKNNNPPFVGVHSYIEAFKAKYSRDPSDDEIYTWGQENNPPSVGMNFAVGDQPYHNASFGMSNILNSQYILQKWRRDNHDTHPYWVSYVSQEDKFYPDLDWWEDAGLIIAIFIAMGSTLIFIAIKIPTSAWTLRGKTHNFHA